MNSELGGQKHTPLLFLRQGVFTVVEVIYRSKNRIRWLPIKTSPCQCCARSKDEEVRGRPRVPSGRDEPARCVSSMTQNTEAPDMEVLASFAEMLNVASCVERCSDNSKHVTQRARKGASATASLARTAAI